MTPLEATALRVALCFSSGYGIKWLGYLETADGARALRLVVNLALPLLLIKTMRFVEIPAADVWLLAVAPAYALLVLPVVYAVLRYRSGLGKNDCAQALMCCSGHAVALVAYPVVQGLYGDLGMALCVLYDIGNCFIAFQASYSIGSALRVEDRDRAASGDAPAGGTPCEGGRRAACGDDPAEGTSCEAIARAASGDDSARSTSCDTSFKIGDAVSPAHCGGARTDAEDVSADRGIALDFSEVVAALGRSRVPSCDDALATPHKPRRGILQGLRHVLLLAPIVGVEVGFLLRAMDAFVPGFQIPASIWGIVEAVASASGPLVLFSFGLQFDIRSCSKRSNVRQLVWTLAGRYLPGMLLGTVALILATSALPDEAFLPCSVLCVAWMMPMPPAVVPFSAELGYDSEFVARVGIITIVVSLCLAFVMAAIIDVVR
eukprot:CAMPEP_0117522466 /NCGR_PEP_ID=MMETSP0784-20121206/34222_1 /TAXON_ID=39447 /ORGANISM="" /LENGTH=432 /DNA_ID=CAMNT_0005318539 /DNA_START=22 /DNA_END=1320 /DNA_ORIENTATION=+